MTKKRIGTKKRKVKKQMKRRSRKMRKSMRGGSRLFVQKIIRCIPQDPVNYPDIPISLSGYQNNDDDWTKLAENISYNGPIEFQCDGKDSQIYGINLDINFDTGTKEGELYGKIGNSRPVRLWWNGRQQTYEAPPSNEPLPRQLSNLHSYESPPRTTSRVQPSRPRNNQVGTNTEISIEDIQSVSRSVAGEEDNTDDDNLVSPSYRRQ